MKLPMHKKITAIESQLIGSFSAGRIKTSYHLHKTFLIIRLHFLRTKILAETSISYMEKIS